MSDQGRDAVAEAIGDVLVFFFGTPWMFIPSAIILMLSGLAWLFGAFPLKKHRFCGGKGHWGIGSFRRRCSGCSGSGLVQR